MPCNRPFNAPYTFSARLKGLNTRLAIDLRLARPKVKCWSSPQLGRSDYVWLPHSTQLVGDRFPLHLPYVLCLISKRVRQTSELYYKQYNSVDKPPLQLQIFSIVLRRVAVSTANCESDMRAASLCDVTSSPAPAFNPQHCGCFVTDPPGKS